MRTLSQQSSKRSGWRSGRDAILHEGELIMTGVAPLLSLCEADGQGGGCAFARQEIALRGRRHNLLEPTVSRDFDLVRGHRVVCFEPLRFDRGETGALNA